MSWFGESFEHSVARMRLKSDADLRKFIKESERRRKIYSAKVPDFEMKPVKFK